MTIERATAAAVSTLLAGVRAELVDPATNPDNTAIPEAARGYTDAAIYAGLNLMIKQMGTEMTGHHAGESLVPVDLTYPANSEAEDLPAGVAASEIFKVEDRTVSTAPVIITGIGPTEITQWEGSSPLYQRGRKVYTLVSNSDGDYQIAIRPNGSAISARIWYCAFPLIVTDPDTGDVDLLLSARWDELLMVGTAVKLKSRVDDVPDQMLARFNDLWDQFLKYSMRVRGPRRIRQARRARA